MTGSPAQNMAALAVANQRRARLCAIRVGLKDGTVELHAALADPAAGKQRVSEVLQFLPGPNRPPDAVARPGKVPRARVQARRLMHRLAPAVTEFTTCGRLTDRQRGLICLAWQAERASWGNGRG